MELAFDTKELRTICENELQAKHDLGDAVSETLKHRLADLQAAKNVKDLLVGNVRRVAIKDGEGMAVDLSEGYTLIFAANHVKMPTATNGKLDWDGVNRIKVMRIEKGNVEYRV